jgi:hypothetical protein
MHQANSLRFPLVAIFGPARPSTAVPTTGGATALISCDDGVSMKEIELKTVLVNPTAYWVRNFKSLQSLTSPFVHLIFPLDIVSSNFLSFSSR